MDNWGKDNSLDALDEYLTAPVIHNMEDPIQYWTGMLQGGSELAQMALDFLSAPGMWLIAICFYNIYNINIIS